MGLGEEFQSLPMTKPKRSTKPSVAAKYCVKADRGEAQAGGRRPFATIVRCTADPAKADKRTRSKWSRVMRYAAVYKLDSEPLEKFVKRKGASTDGRFGIPGALPDLR
jgi:hypothetical protein